MKRKVLIFIMWLAAVITAQAQSGLNVSPLFEGKVIPQERMIETRVKGKSLSKYQLSFFRSVRFDLMDVKDIRRIRNLVEQDQQHSINSQSQKSHSSETMMLKLPKENGKNRYLCYKRLNSEITVVYMEGSLSSLDDLKNILK